MNLLEVQSISKTYGSGETAVHALKGATFSVPKGEFVAIVGESGSGKSTLLNLIGALDALMTLDGLLYILLYVFGLAFAFYPLSCWCKENEGFSWPWPRVESEKKRIKKLRRQQEAEKAEREEK